MGERQGDREVLDRLTKDAIDAGMSSETARRKAREAMLEVDRRLREQGKR